MSKPHDQYARLLLDQMLSGYGSVVQEFALSPSPTRFVDVAFVPGETAPDAIPLGAMVPVVQTPVLCEAFSGTPGPPEYERVLGKVLDVRRQALRRKATALQRALRDAVAWMLCAGHPRSLLRLANATPLAGAPRGFYETGALHPVRVVSIAQLDDTDDTLLLRLFAKRLRRRSAQATLRARSREDPRLMPLLETMVEYARRLRFNPDADEDAMVDLTEARKLLAAVKQEGRDEGLSQGLSQGLLLLTHQFARRLRRPLSAAERATLSARFAEVGPERLGDVVLDLSPDALARWLADPAAS